MGGAISRVALTKLETRNILYSFGIILPAVQKIKSGHASVISHKALTLADCSKEKLLNNTNCQVLLYCAVIGSYGPCANLLCSQLVPLSPVYC